MGHAIGHLVVSKRSEIMRAAEEYAFRNTDRCENPSGSYHGNMHVHDRPICESEEEAEKMIESWDTGWYSDHAVQFKDKSVLKPTKQMIALNERKQKLINDRDEYKEKHSLKNRKSELVGCKNCGSKIATSFLKNHFCPVCGKDLWADYILERIKKYNADIKDVERQYNELKKKQSGKCPIRWLVKVEVHC